MDMSKKNSEILLAGIWRVFYDYPGKNDNSLYEEYKQLAQCSTLLLTWLTMEAVESSIWQILTYFLTVISHSHMETKAYSRRDQEFHYTQYHFNIAKNLLQSMRQLFEDPSTTLCFVWGQPCLVRIFPLVVKYADVLPSVRLKCEHWTN